MTSPPQISPASLSGLGSVSIRLLFLDNRPFSRNSSPFAAEMLTLRLRRQQDLECLPLHGILANQEAIDLVQGDMLLS